MRRSRPGGFTLIELLLVVVIIGILAAIVVPRLASRSEEANISRAQGDLHTLNMVLEAYALDNGGKYPTTEQGLMALIEPPTIPPEPKKWKGPYLKNATEVQKDPWDHDYVYRCPGQKFPKGYDLFSLGPDEAEGTEDDIWQ